MIARCRSIKPSDSEAAAASIDFTGLRQPYAVTVGKSYVVLGLTFSNAPSLLGTDGAITYTENDRYILSAPLAMFEIVDPRPSTKWTFGRSQNGEWCFWPPSFFADFYADKLSDGDPAMVDDFQRIYAELRAESGIELRRND